MRPLCYWWWCTASFGWRSLLLYTPLCGEQRDHPRILPRPRHSAFRAAVGGCSKIIRGDRASIWRGFIMAIVPRPELCPSPPAHPPIINGR